MNRRILAAALAALALVSVPFLFAQKDPNDLKFPDLEFTPQKPSLTVIKPGLDFYFKEDREFPAVSGTLFLKTGSLSDPKGREGLAGLTLTLLKSGGTLRLAPDALEERLDFLGSSVNAYASGEYSLVNFWTLKKNFAETWKIVTEMLQHPAFDPARFESEKQKSLEGIRRRWDRPTTIGRYLFYELVYGRDFPEARRTTSASLQAVRLEDVKDFYARNIKDRELIVALAGDFDTPQASEMIGRSLADWQARPAEKLALPKASLAAKPGVYLVDKPDMTQAVVCLGHLGINRLDRDNVEIGIMNFILGSGGFNSRILREVRSNRGLAYSAFGAVGAGRDLGIFFNFTQTKSQSVGEAIRLIKDIIVDMTRNSVSEAELTTAKKYEQNAFVHRFDSSMSVLQETISNKLDGLPDDYLETYIPRIKTVDAAMVLEMARRTMHPDELVILVVGNKSEILDQLKALNLGEVTELPLPND
jgi:zinc protease